MDKYEWMMVIVGVGFVLWFLRELGYIRLPTWGPGRKARKQAAAAAQAKAQEVQALVDAQIADAVCAGQMSVRLDPKLFDYNREVMRICAKNCRRAGYSVYNKDLGRGIYDFTVSW